MLKQLFNYYIILKTCWIILLFQLIGFMALIVFDQGQDILRTLSFSAQGNILIHTWATLFAVLWWSWQSWRSARAQLHFTTFDFVKFNERYSLQAQVLIPRLLGTVPMFIFAYGLVKASGWYNPQVYLYLCLAAWLYIFLHLRKDIIVYFLSRNKYKLLKIPDYILIKNKAYPASFIWKKQGKWIIFRLLCIVLIFTLVVIYPVKVPQTIGSSAIILYALGAWLVIGTFVDFAEKHYRIPFTFTIIVMVIFFSFNNNNHHIRLLDKQDFKRPKIEEHFLNWHASREACMNDSVPVILVAAQGGGVRASYWTAQVLSEMQENNPRFDSYVYGYNAVSGGTLGVAVYKNLVKNGFKDLKEQSHKILSKDFLSPVSSWLVIPDLMQKFLPFPVNRVDRAKALEYSWEDAARLSGKNILGGGFLAQTIGDSALYFFNSTKAENGFTTLISNADCNKNIFPLKEDLFSAINCDIPQTTAISLSARFPFLTPPGLITDTRGKTWGHLVDGGYVDNMGAGTMLELYDYLRELSVKHQLKTKFILVFIKNTKAEYNSNISGLHELVVPVNTFSKVWVNSGNYSKNSTKLRNLGEADEAIFVNLNRDGDKLIPLGWYLSPKAINIIRDQLEDQTLELKEKLKCISLPVDRLGQSTQSIKVSD